LCIYFFRKLNKFSEIKHFISFSQKNEKTSGGKTNKEYYLTVDMKNRKYLLQSENLIIEKIPFKCYNRKV